VVENKIIDWASPMSDFFNFLDLMVSVLRCSSPLLLAALAGLYSERSGVIQISLEGFMLAGAFSAASFASFIGSGAYGMVFASLVGLVCALCYGLLVIGLKVDQIIAGTVINMLAWGGIPIISKVVFGSSASTPALDISVRLPSWFPIVLALIAFALTTFLFRRTALGLWLTFAGENPGALQSVGVSVFRIRWFAVCTSGVLAALGGAALSVCLSSSYTRNMTAGRGFMALAALILGKWRPVEAFFACLLFGASDVLQMRLQGASLPIFGALPNQLVQVLPYALTLLLLTGMIGRSSAPAKLGQPF
jgi:simple sugar transport system permease protein